MSSPAPPVVTCPDAETLAALAEGRLSREESGALMAHIDGCDDCLAALEAANETIATRNVTSISRRNTWWLAAAAAVVIGVVALLVPRLPFAQRSPTARLIELMPRSARPVEPRLCGGFPWAPYQGPTRADEGSADPQRMKLIGGAGEIVAEADRDRSPAAEHAAGVALVLIDKPVYAIDRLRSTVQTSPADANAWSDLAAAQYAAALHHSRMSLLPEALHSADRALRIDPRHPEALFNRALIVERLGLTREARAAWERYLRVDSTSAWAVEARARLAELNATPAATQTDAQRMRRFAEAETLGRWAEATRRGDAEAARHELTDARTAGDTLARTSRESLLREAVRAIDDAAPPDRATLADAHFLYRRGRIAYSKRQLDGALADLTGAVPLFEQARSPMSLVARYYAACVRFDRSDVAGARGALQTLLAEADARPGFIALGAEVRWELALTFMVDSDWTGALPLLQQSCDAFRGLDERNHLGFVESLLADTLLSLGRPDEAWAARARAFTLLSADGSGDRLPVSMKAAAQMEARSGRLKTARAILDVAREMAGAISSDAVAADLLVHSALVDVALRDGDEAARAVREATEATSRIGDPNARRLAQAHLELAGAATVLTSDPARAREMLSRAIDGYGSSGRVVFLPECFLLRARAALRSGDATSAAEDLEAGIATLARSHIRTGAIVGTGVLDAANALFEDAIRLSADRADLETAFAYAERSRTQLARPVTVRALQSHLSSSDAAFLRIVSLPDELIAICVTSRGEKMERRAIPRSTLERLANSVDDERTLTESYDLLVRPFESMIAASRALVVVADRPLQNFPFAALYDSSTRRYLVERLAVSMAMSASTLQPMQRMRPRSLLAVTLPSGGANAGLPESVREAGEVASLYADAVTIAPDGATIAAFADAATGADVIHVAGHTKRESDDTGTALMYADGRLTWSAIASRGLVHAPVVVLAACETLRQSGAASTRSMTLGDGFLAAGARDVIGTLTPIADADARRLFHSIHRRLAAGEDAPAAVRAAQIEAISRRHSGSWRAVASLTRGISTNREGAH